MNDIAGRLARESEAAKALLEEFAAAIGDDDELRETTIEGATDVHEAAHIVVARLKEIKGLLTGVKTQQDDLKTRRQRYERQDERLREALRKTMKELRRNRPFEFDIGTVGTMRLPDGVVYDDESQVPAGYWKPGKPVLDKDAVRTDLEAGKEVPGARLEKNRSTLAIRFT